MRGARFTENGSTLQSNAEGPGDSEYLGVPGGVPVVGPGCFLRGKSVWCSSLPPEAPTLNDLGDLNLPAL